MITGETFSEVVLFPWQPPREADFGESASLLFITPLRRDCMEDA